MIDDPDQMLSILEIALANVNARAGRQAGRYSEQSIAKAICRMQR